MLGKLIPVILALVGLGGGVGAGLFLRPAPAAEEHAAEGTDPAKAGEHGEAPAKEATDPDAEPEEGAPEYVKMNNQFVVPVVEDGRVVDMIAAADVEASTGKLQRYLGV